jgi:hypothetical protein
MPPDPTSGAPVDPPVDSTTASPSAGSAPPVTPDTPPIPPTAGTPPASPSADGAPPQEPPAPVSPFDGFREKWAAGDQQKLTWASRFADVGALTEAAWNAHRRISQGDLAKPLPENPTPEQVTEYRKAHGIPEAVEGYYEKMPNGIVFGDDDRTVFSGYFGQVLLEHNIPPKVAHGLMAAYNKMQQDYGRDAAENDQVHLNEAREALRETWGADYKVNNNVLTQHLAAMPKDVQAALAEARMPDGRKVLNNPEFLRYLTQQAREINPVITLVPGEGGGGIDAEIATIQKWMNTNDPRYWKDETTRARYTQLLEAQQRVEQRKAS